MGLFRKTVNDFHPLVLSVILPDTPNQWELSSHYRYLTINRDVRIRVDTWYVLNNFFSVWPSKKWHGARFIIFTAPRPPPAVRAVRYKLQPLTPLYDDYPPAGVAV